MKQKNKNMKEQNTTIKKSLFKKIFIKICRLLGYEIIDQSNYEISTLNKNLGESISVPGKKSVTIPLGHLKITRKIKSLKIIFRSCTSELIMDQNKKRLFDKSKNEYTFRALNSLLKSITEAKKIFHNINYDIVVSDTNSSENDLILIKNILSKHKINHRLIEINLDSYKEKISGQYTKAKFANMANLHCSLTLSKETDSDLIFFVEDDYIHTKNSILEMLFSYEKFTSMFKKEIFLLPADYPYLYTRDSNTKIFLGNQKHWRLVDESLVSRGRH